MLVVNRKNAGFHEKLGRLEGRPEGVWGPHRRR